MLAHVGTSFSTLRSGQVQLVPNEIIDGKFSNASVGTNATYVLGKLKYSICLFYKYFNRSGKSHIINRNKINA